MHDATAERQRRAAENQSVFRSVNDRVKELNEVFDALTPYGEWVCECDGLECFEKIHLTLHEYEQLRQQSNRFAVAPGDEHVNLEVEQVVARTERYWLVEKVDVAAERAAEFDAQGI